MSWFWVRYSSKYPTWSLVSTLTWSWFVCGGNKKEKRWSSPFHFWSNESVGTGIIFRNILAWFLDSAGLKFFWYKLTIRYASNCLREACILFFSSHMKRLSWIITPVFSFFPFLSYHVRKNDLDNWWVSLEEGNRHGLLSALCPFSLGAAGLQNACPGLPFDIW